MGALMTATATKQGREEGQYHVKLPVFEGPFDLLFYLVKKEELDIWDIPLAKITEEYLQYLQSMQEIKIEPAGEFLVMAASLLYLKSQLLLPQNPALSSEMEAEALFFGSKEELVNSLLEYKRFKIIAAGLKKREGWQQRVFLRSVGRQRVVIVDRQCRLYPVDLENLQKAYRQLMKRKAQQKAMVTLPEEISFSRKLQKIFSRLKDKGFLGRRLDDFWERQEKEEIVLTLAIFLELAKRGKVYLRQEGIFQDINVLATKGKGALPQKG